MTKTDNYFQAFDDTPENKVPLFAVGHSPEGAIIYGVGCGEPAKPFAAINASDPTSLHIARMMSIAPQMVDALTAYSEATLEAHLAKLQGREADPKKIEAAGTKMGKVIAALREASPH